jgi:hypothetical protein
MTYCQDDMPDKWTALAPVDRAELEKELAKETVPGHQLFGKRVTAIARRLPHDDTLFEVEDADAHFYVVHLTWSEEHLPDWPWCVKFADFNDFRLNWRRIFD